MLTCLQLHLVTEFIDSGTLERLVMDKAQPLSWGLKMELAGDIANGMAYLHEQSVIHRDLKTGEWLANRRVRSPLKAASPCNRQPLFLALAAFSRHVDHMFLT